MRLRNNLYNSVTELEMETDIVRKCIADYLHKIDRYRQQRDELQGRIDAARRKIAWHEKRIIRLSEQQKRIERPWWTKEIVAPLMREVARLTPDVAWSAENLYTHGLRAACSVYGEAQNGGTVGLTFTFDGGVLSYDTGEVTRRFAPGTLGEINGMNNVCAPVESVDTLVAKVNGQRVELKSQADEPV